MLVSVSSVISLPCGKQLINAQVIGEKQSIASQKWLRTDLYCLLLHFFFFLEILPSLPLKEIVFDSSKQAFSKMAL